MADTSEDDEYSGTPVLLQESLGITPEGTCLRHPNCPVLSMAHNKLVSCRVCFAEEQSIGVVTKSFAHVVTQLQHLHTDRRWNDNDEAKRKQAHKASLQGVLLQKLPSQQQQLDAIMKRLAQVQNWMLRQKEKEVLSLQLHIHRLEEQLNDSDMLVREQKQTILALRRTLLQNDPMKMDGSSSTVQLKESDLNDSKDRLPPMRDVYEDKKDDPPEDDDDDEMEEEDDAQSEPSRSRNRFRPTMEARTPSPSSRRFQLDPPRGRKKPSVLPFGLELPERQPSTRSLASTKSCRSMDDTLPLPPPSSTTLDQRPPSYWSADSTATYTSFRGSLLDSMVPKAAPPPNRTDRPKLRLDSFEKDSLQLQAHTKPSPTKLPMGLLTALHKEKPPIMNKLAFPGLDTDEDELSEATPLGEGLHETKHVQHHPCSDRYGDPGLYTGPLDEDGLPHGRGTLEYESGRVYTGHWVAGQWHGHGHLLNPNGDEYEGDFVLDWRHGDGVYRWANGDVYDGQFSQDQRHGHGRFSFHQNGNVYEGEFAGGKFDGQGRYEFEGGYYNGEWKEGRYHGQGHLVYANGVEYTGEFRNSVAHGFGTEVAADGSRRRGMWQDGQPSTTTRG